MQIITGGVTAPKGFLASGVHCGIRKNKIKKDLALILAQNECNAAAVFTTNKAAAAPIWVSKKHLENGKAKAILVNSGNANACAKNGVEYAQRMCESLALLANIQKEDIIVNSTGVIGVELPILAIESGMEQLVSTLSSDASFAAEAIMTTDLSKKEIAVSFVLNGKEVKIGGMAKGSGMIHPNMATMMALLTTDCAISSELLQEALLQSTRKTYNRVSVDGDTSTNDMAAILASGLSGNAPIDTKNEDYFVFLEALDAVNLFLAKEIAKDGEGATKLIVCCVQNAKDEETAETLAKAVIGSSLVKTAMFGADANWGRVLCAMGYSGATFSPDKVDISFASTIGQVKVCQNGQGVNFIEPFAKEILSEKEISILVNCHEGKATVEAYGCDLTYDYVKINGDYRT